MNKKQITKKLNRILDNLDDKIWDLNTGVTYYQIKSGCDRATAIEIVRKSMRIQQEIKEVLPKLELMIKFYISQIDWDDLSDDEKRVFEELIQEVEEVFGPLGI